MHYETSWLNNLIYIFWKFSSAIDFYLSQLWQMKWVCLISNGCVKFIHIYEPCSNICIIQSSIRELNRILNSDYTGHNETIVGKTILFIYFENFVPLFNFIYIFLIKLVLWWFIMKMYCICINTAQSC